ncbi:hypothetical protein O181_029707 [Austropuccinia psidii MF-1]|uniref:FCH domain-containing protein n=1 Tax=Austropuccinia psidii MF-1 TaxID=1389203 RepID=A0A9Q3CX48_9BASI|nr:hypothetical protein [Austropuccinia psidii MF-1]
MSTEVDQALAHPNDLNSNLDDHLNQSVSSDFYFESFKDVQPRLAHKILTDRLKQAKVFNDELIDYFKERLAIEDQFVKALMRLSKKPNSIFTSSNSSQSQHQFQNQSQIQTIKNSLYGELIEIVDCHSTLQSKLQDQVLEPLKNCKILNNFSWNSKFKSLEDQTNQIIKNLDESSQKLSKSKQKINLMINNNKKNFSLQDKLNQDQAQFDESKKIWLDHSFKTFNSYQSFDFQRLINTIDSLAKSQTIQIDHNKQKINSNEKRLSTFINLNPQNDLNQFVTFYRKTLNSSQPSSLSASQHLQQNSLKSTLIPNSNHTHQSVSNSNQTIFDSSPSVESNQLQPSNLNLSNSNPPKSSSKPLNLNHTALSDLNAPNIRIPIRSQNSLSNTSSESPLPSRSLYVQPQSSNLSINALSQSGPSTNLNHSYNLPNHSKQPKIPTGTSQKFFSKAKINNILSRHPHNLSHSKSHRPMSIINQSGDRLINSTNSNIQSRRPSIENSHHVRSATMTDSNPTSNQKLYSLNPLPSPSPCETKPNKTFPRLGHFLPGTGSASNLLRRKLSHSNLHHSNSSSSQSNQNPIRIDSEGYSIPPENHNRKPWTGNDDSEVLSTENHKNFTSQSSHSRSRSNFNWSDGNHTESINNLTLKSSSVISNQNTEAEQLAAIQKVQSTLASGIGNLNLSQSNNSAALGPTRRSNTALRGRRADGRGATMYDSSPSVISSMPPSGLVRSNTTLDRSTSKNSYKSALPSVELNSLNLGPSLSETLNNLNQTDSSDQMTQVPLDSSLNSTFSKNQLVSSTNGKDFRANSITSLISGSHNLLNSESQATSSNEFNHKISSKSTLPVRSLNPFMTATLAAGFQSYSSKFSQDSSKPLMIVTEKLNVLMNEGKIIKLFVLGEITVRNEFLDQVKEKTEKIEFKIHHHHRLEKIAFPNELVSRSHGIDGQFELDVKRLKTILANQLNQSTISNDHCVLKYRLFYDCKENDGAIEIADQFVPMFIIPKWRTLKEKTELVINYHSNPKFQRFHQDLDLPNEDQQRCIEEFELSTMIYNPNSDILPKHTKKVTIIEHLTQPIGKWNENENEIYWNLGNLDLKHLGGKVIGRFIHHEGLPNQKTIEIGDRIEQANDNDDGFNEKNCGPIKVNWKMKDVLISGIAISIQVDKEQTAENSEEGRNALPFNGIENDKLVKKLSQSATFLAR